MIFTQSTQGSQSRLLGKLASVPAHGQRDTVFYFLFFNLCVCQQGYLCALRVKFLFLRRYSKYLYQFHHLSHRQFQSCKHCPAYDRMAD